MAFSFRVNSKKSDKSQIFISGHSHKFELRAKFTELNYIWCIIFIKIKKTKQKTQGEKKKCQARKEKIHWQILWQILPNIIMD